MARARYYDVVQFPDPATGLIHKVNTVEITIYQEGTTTLLADIIYQDDSGVDTYANPRTITDGVLEFFLETEKRVSIKFDATGSGYGSITKDYEGVWPDPGLLRQTIRSPDGNQVVSISNSQIFTAPGLLRSHKVYNPVDFGVVEEASSTYINAASNTTILEGLYDQIAADGGGTIKHPGNSLGNHFAYDPCSFNHGLGFAMAVNFDGEPYATYIGFNGTSGYFWDFATAVNSQIARGVIKNLVFHHGGGPTQDATLRLGAVTDYTLENVKLLFSGSEAAAFCALTLGHASFACGNITLENCDFKITDNKANAPIIRLINGGGLSFVKTALEGGSVTAKSNVIGIHCANTNSWDTIHSTNLGIGFTKYGIWVPNSSVFNVQMSNTFIDTCGTTGILVQSTSGQQASFWQLTNTWVTSDGHHIEIDASTGTVYDWQLANFIGREGCTAESIILNGDVKTFIATNFNTQANMSFGGAVVDILQGRDIVFSGGKITGLGSAASTIKAASGVDPLFVALVHRGVNKNILGSPSASRKYIDDNNPFLIGS